MSESLSQRLQRFRIQNMIREAEMIRDDPPSQQRSKEAASLIYTVMYQHALGRLSNAEREQILQIVNFARDFHAPEQQETLPRIHPLD
jgi:hypothetical protein